MANIFRVSAVIEEQDLRRDFLGRVRNKALTAGSRIRRHNALAYFEFTNALTDLHDVSGELMAEQGWRADHARVVAPTEYLYVGAAR